MIDLDALRTHMVEAHLAKRGISSPRVLDAFRAVPREAFVSDDLAPLAYEDGPLPIGEGQTISQPYIVALMVDSLDLRGDERVLDVGTGSGYAAAILSRTAKEVYSIERVASLGRSARERLERLGFGNVHVTVGDGSLGWPEHAPYDAISVAAAGPKIPEALLAQLAIGGRLVMPIGQESWLQTLTLVTRVSETELQETEITGVQFVSLIGEEGFPEGEQPRPTRVAPEAAEPLR
jgi:protein-L-isoaspartate(D-aspartate) O-methyltransferase